jgi:hypothetical protein
MLFKVQYRDEYGPWESWSECSTLEDAREDVDRAAPDSFAVRILNLTTSQEVYYWESDPDGGEYPNARYRV